MKQPIYNTHEDFEIGACHHCRFCGSYFDGPSTQRYYVPEEYPPDEVRSWAEQIAKNGLSYPSTGKETKNLTRLVYDMSRLLMGNPSDFPGGGDTVENPREMP